jgi:hypothetical protein
MDSADDPRTTSGTWRKLMWAAIAAILIAPLVAMQLTEEVNWTGFDFAVAGGLLIAGGLGIEAATRLFADPKLRFVIGALLFAAVAFIWADGAVGIF